MKFREAVVITLGFAVFWAVSQVYAGTLVCSVATSCPSGTVMLRLSSTTNAHAELPTQSAYPQVVCCSGVPGLGTSCSGTFAALLKLSSTTNAHVEQGTLSNYANSACLSAAGGSVSVGYQAGNCTGFDTTVASISSTTNAHVGDANAYATKVCATAGGSSGPTVSAVTLNGGNAINLTPNTTTSIHVSFTISDPTNCADVFTGGTVTTTVYRSGAGNNCTANNQSCYITTASVNNCSGGTSANATATVGIYYFAQATDASSTFPTQNWLAQVSARDAANGTSTASSVGIELNTLLAIDVPVSTLAYGSLSPGSNTGSSNQTVSVRNVGNSSSTVRVSGTNLASGSNNIATTSQHYAATPFTFGAAEAVLTDIATTVSGLLLGTPTSTSILQANTFWGIQVPAGRPIGTYSGTNIFTAVFSP